MAKTNTGVPDEVIEQLRGIIAVTGRWVAALERKDHVDYNEVAKACKGYEKLMHNFINAGYESPKPHIFLRSVASTMSFATSRALQQNDIELYARLRGSRDYIYKYLGSISLS